MMAERLSAETAVLVSCRSGKPRKSLRYPPVVSIRIENSKMLIIDIHCCIYNKGKVNSWSKMSVADVNAVG